MSETPFAPRIGATEEGDGYLVSFITNTNTRKGECAIFDAREIERGPLCTVILPDHVPTGTHTYWAPDALLSKA